jgi:hypothetical protein
MSDLYGDDILLWCEQQADALRRRAADHLDWDNLAEEIEDVGRSELRTVETLLVQALRHMPKAKAWPLHRDAPSWRRTARLDASIPSGTPRLQRNTVLDYPRT